MRLRRSVVVVAGTASEESVDVRASTEQVPNNVPWYRFDRRADPRLGVQPSGLATEAGTDNAR